MRKNICLLVLIFFIVNGCAVYIKTDKFNNKDNFNDENVLLTINNKKITIEDFEQEYRISRADVSPDELNKLIDDHITINKILYAASELGLNKSDTYMYLINRYRKQLLIDMFNEHYISRIKKPSELEIKEYYQINKENFLEPVKISLYNFISSDKNLIIKVYDKLKKGFKPGELKNDTELINVRIADLGIIGPGYLDTVLEEKALKLEKGQFSQIIFNKVGYNILYCYNRIDNVYTDYETVKNQIYETVYENRFNEAVKDEFERIHNIIKPQKISFEKLNRILNKTGE